MSVSVVVDPFRFAAPSPAVTPFVAASALTENATSATSHTVNIPAVQAGDLIVLIANGASDASYTMSTPSGYQARYNSTNGNLRGACFFRVAPTTASASTVSVSLSSGVRLSAVALAVRDWDEGELAEDALQASNAATGNSASPNPPSLSIPWGTDAPSLVLAAAHSAAGGSITYPSSYTDGLTAYTGVFNSFHARTSLAEREVTASSEDPGTFGIGNNVLWIARTLAVKGTA